MTSHFSTVICILMLLGPSSAIYLLRLPKFFCRWVDHTEDSLNQYDWKLEWVGGDIAKTVYPLCSGRIKCCFHLVVLPPIYIISLAQNPSYSIYPLTNSLRHCPLCPLSRTEWLALIMLISYMKAEMIRMLWRIVRNLSTRRKMDEVLYRVAKHHTLTYRGKIGCAMGLISWQMDWIHRLFRLFGRFTIQIQSSSQNNFLLN